MADINFTALALASFIFAISPGPGIVAVLATSVSRGAIIASAMSVGAVCGDMIYLLLAMLSLASIAQGIDEIMLVVRVLGGCYLGWIKPSNGIFIFLIIIIFLLGNLIFKSYSEYSLNCLIFLTP